MRNIIEKVCKGIMLETFPEKKKKKKRLESADQKNSQCSRIKSDKERLVTDKNSLLDQNLVRLLNPLLGSSLHFLVKSKSPAKSV